MGLVFLSINLAFTSHIHTTPDSAVYYHEDHMQARSRALAEAGISELSLGEANGAQGNGAVAVLCGPARLLNVSNIL
jgi:hypothetical protein